MSLRRSNPDYSTRSASRVNDRKCTYIVLFLTWMITVSTRITVDLELYQRVAYSERDRYRLCYHGLPCEEIM